MVNLNEVEEDLQHVLPLRCLIVLEQDVEHVENGTLEIFLELLDGILLFFLVPRSMRD